MISHINIKNFAIIKELDAAFFPGLSVVTGETGAGKSIVIEALSMALGSRADKAMVRMGADKAVVTLLLAQGEEEGGSAQPADPLPEILVREIGAAGKSLCRADGELVTLAQLEAFTAGHVDVHGQYDHQSLLVPEKHIGLLDAYGRTELAPAAARVSAAFSVYREASRRLSDILAGALTTERELDFLRFEIREIEAACLTVGEDEELEARIRIMQSGEKIYAALSAAYGLLSGETAEGVSALSLTGSIAGSLSGLSDYDGEFAAMAEMSAEVRYTLEELETQVRKARDRMEFSQAELDQALFRLDQIDRLKSKYGGDVAFVLAHLDQAIARTLAAENSDVQRASLEKELAAATEALEAASEALSKQRHEVAARLEDAITQQLSALNFKDATFRVQIKRIPEGYSEGGFDQVEFMLSANKGQPLLPLAKVASGGELSRIMLAFKAVTGEFDGVETMIFDEIDSGISGVTASIVGEKLRGMAQAHQIICITHLPQIAAYADHHYFLEKHTDEGETFTTLRELSEEARIDEIARLASGRSLTETARENARELIRQARG